MPIYQVDIEKFYQNEYWTNVYHVEADDLEAAVGYGSEITAIEQALHYDAVTFTKTRVSSVEPDDGIFSTQIVNQPGGAAGSPEYLPLPNCIRIDFQVFGGRNLRKFMRLPLLEGQQTAGLLGSATITDWNTNYVATIVALGYVCSPTGTHITSGYVLPQVANHQLRRGSKRKLAPII
jgi:hypothetical protein